MDNKHLNDSELENVSAGMGVNEGDFMQGRPVVGAPQMDGKILTETELENVNGGLAPDLPATQLAGTGYEDMFEGCENLKYIP